MGSADGQYVLDIAEAGVDYRAATTDFWITYHKNSGGDFVLPRWNVSTNNDTFPEFYVTLEVAYPLPNWIIAPMYRGAPVCRVGVDVSIASPPSFDSSCFARNGKLPDGLRVTATAQMLVENGDPKSGGWDSVASDFTGWTGFVFRS